MDLDLQALIDLINAHKWVALSALVIGAVVRMLKTDTPIPVDIPTRWRPVLALGLGIVSGVLEAAATGKPWSEALVGGAVSAFVAMSGHALLIDALRGGRDLGSAKADKGTIVIGDMKVDGAAIGKALDAMTKPPPGGAP